MTLLGLRQALGRVGLPVWFLLIDTQLIGQKIQPGGDAVLYARGARAFLDGGNPWDAVLVGSGQSFHFAGLPPTVLAFIPFAGLAEAATAWGWVALSVASALYIVRRLRLPWWYLAFPPLVLGVYAGNPQIALLALLLAGAGPLGAMLKVYAVVPLAGEGRWRALAVTVGIFGASVLVAPGLWTSWLGQLGAVSATLASEANGGFSAWGQPWPLLLATVVALVVIAWQDRRAAGWLAVPALWPASEYYYATMILPLATPLLAFAMAIPWYGVPALVTVGYAVTLLVRAYGKGRRPFRPAVLAGAA
ncbi:MAG TPA: hypothetical protein VMH24_01190 [Candidatus Sulfotelmatobacter sp.]|nr:hypothetical protein [Candidatus Sulfotelmatobacter sp.]